MTKTAYSAPSKVAYDVLGVSPSDTFGTIRAAYRCLVKAHHPDLVGNDTAEATARLASINEAWDALRHHAASDARAALRARREQAEAVRRAADAARAEGRADETAEAAARRLAREKAAEAERRRRMEANAARAEARAASRAQAEELARIERARRAADARAALRPVTEKYRSARAVFDQTDVLPSGRRADLCA